MRILVTGGAGYIGSILAPALLDKKYHVTVLDNFIYGQATLLERCHDKNFQIVRGDARDPVIISRLMKGADVIIPLACVVGAPACDKDPIAAKTTNLETIRMILGIRSKGQAIIFPNTNSGYGIGQEDIFCTEESPLNPISLYGKLKVEAESAVLSAGNSVALRLATVFGVSPRMRLDLLVNDFTYRAVNDGFMAVFEPHFKRNFIHVRDVARAFIHAIENFESMNGEPYNVGLSDANLSKWELCQEIQKQIPGFVFFEGKGKDPDKRNYIVSNKKIEKTGFKPKVSLQEGIAELIKGFQIIKRHQFSNA